MKQVLVFILFMISTQSTALSFDDAAKETKELYLKSGLKRQIDAFPSIILAQVEAKFKSDAANNNKKVTNVTKIVKIIRSVFNSPDLKHQSLDILTQEFTLDETKQLLSWFKSSVGKKVAWYEDHLSTPAGYIKLAEYEKNLINTPPTDDYRIKIKILTKNMNVLEAAVDMAMINEVIVSSSLASIQSNFTTEILDSITERIESDKPILKKQVSEHMDPIMLFTYSYLSKMELNKYLEFTESPLGKKYFLVLIKALGTTFRNASIEYKEKMLVTLINTDSNF